MEQCSQDVALFATIVGTAKQAASRTLPRVTFQVLFWDHHDDAEWGNKESQLRDLGVAVHPISTILPGFPAERARTRSALTTAIRMHRPMPASPTLRPSTR